MLLDLEVGHGSVSEVQKHISSRCLRFRQHFIVKDGSEVRFLAFCLFISHSSNTVWSILPDLNVSR